jgi:hypothetical protein
MESIKQSTSRRCFIKECNKKLSISEGVICKCSNLYCGKHRYASDHSCSYDYIACNKDKLQKELIKINGTKVIKI